MDSRILNKKGLTVLEVMVAIAILSVLLSMIIISSKRRINMAMLEGTVNEMMSIAQASLDYHNSQGNWPVATTDLFPTYMAAVRYSPFGGKYQINSLGDSVNVLTTVPSGLAEKYYQGALLEILPGVDLDTIEISQQLPNEFSGRLEYEKKYRYQQ